MATTCSFLLVAVAAFVLQICDGNLQNKPTPLAHLDTPDIKLGSNEEAKKLIASKNIEAISLGMMWQSDMTDVMDAVNRKIDQQRLMKKNLNEYQFILATYNRILYLFVVRKSEMCKELLTEACDCKTSTKNPNDCDSDVATEVPVAVTTKKPEFRNVCVLVRAGFFDTFEEYLNKNSAFFKRL